MKYNTKSYDYLVVGSGPFGSVFANEVSKKGKRVLIIDRRSHAGGNMYTSKFHGINVHDYGPHIFHTNNKDLWNYVDDLVNLIPYTNQVVANYKGELYNLPFNMNTFYQMWGTKTPDEAYKKIAGQQLNVSTPRNLEEQAISLIGTDIYEKLIKGYTEKQWGRKATELPSFIIKRLPVRFNFDNNYYNDKYQGIPEDGYSIMFDKLLSSDLIDLRLDTDFLSDKDTFLAEFPKIIYTGMIDEFFEYEFGELEYRSLNFVTELHNNNNVQGTAVMNYTDSETPYTRRIEWRKFDNKAEEGYSVITKEYPQEWKKGKEAYYPINNNKNSEIYRKYKKKALTMNNIIFGGRLGDYQYYDMDQVIYSAIKLAGKEI